MSVTLAGICLSNQFLHSAKLGVMLSSNVTAIRTLAVPDLGLGIPRLLVDCFGRKELNLATLQFRSPSGSAMAWAWRVERQKVFQWSRNGLVRRALYSKTLGSSKKNREDIWVVSDVIWIFLIQSNWKSISRFHTLSGLLIRLELVIFECFLQLKSLTITYQNIVRLVHSWR